ncbi:PaaI family thioesterase, partial [Bacteroidota bacterium]|nr:PaaI family thioesterase [Bacteroidota bacterium]
PGEVNYFVEVSQNHLATYQSAHGGFLAGVFDQIVGTAALTKAMYDHKLVSTVEFKINYLKPAYLNDKLKGVGKVLHHGKRLYTVEGQIFNHKQELLAKGIATLNAYSYDKSDMKFL